MPTPLIGSGTEISIGDAKKYIKDYYDLYMAAFNEINSSDGFAETKKFLALDRQIMSGIYGKDKINEVLSQGDCKGIRYALAMYQDKITIILIGVKSNGEPKLLDEDEGSVVLNNLDDWKSRSANDSAKRPGDPVVIEIHRASMDANTLKDYLNL